MQEKKPRRRVIRVGSRVLTGLICPRCIQRTVIFPESALEPHIARHNAAPEPVARYRGGRTPGALNRYGSMSSTGVEKKRGIKTSR